MIRYSRAPLEDLYQITQDVHRVKSKCLSASRKMNQPGTKVSEHILNKPVYSRQDQSQEKWPWVPLTKS